MLGILCQTICDYTVRMLGAILGGMYFRPGASWKKRSYEWLRWAERHEERRTHSLIFV